MIDALCLYDGRGRRDFFRKVDATTSGLREAASKEDLSPRTTSLYPPPVVDPSQRSGVFQAWLEVDSPEHSLFAETLELTDTPQLYLTFVTLRPI